MRHEDADIACRAGKNLKANRYSTRERALLLGLRGLALEERVHDRIHGHTGPGNNLRIVSLLDVGVAHSDFLTPS